MRLCNTIALLAAAATTGSADSASSSGNDKNSNKPSYVPMRALPRMSENDLLLHQDVSLNPRFAEALNNASMLLPRANCLDDQQECHGLCIFGDEHCCGDKQQTGFCSGSEECTDDGCCNRKENPDCSNLGDCADDQLDCNGACMPKGAHCCGNREFCPGGYHCSGKDSCKKGAGATVGVPGMGVAAGVAMAVVVVSML